MNLNYKLIFFAAILFTGFLFSNAHGTNNAKYNSNLEQENKTIVLKQNGINVFIIETSENGKRFLEVSIENSNSNDIKISWTLLNKDNESLINSIVFLKSKASYRNHESNRTVELKPNQSITDFRIELKEL